MPIQSLHTALKQAIENGTWSIPKPYQNSSSSSSSSSFSSSFHLSRKFGECSTSSLNAPDSQRSSLFITSDTNDDDEEEDISIASTSTTSVFNHVNDYISIPVGERAVFQIPIQNQDESKANNNGHKSNPSLSDRPTHKEEALQEEEEKDNINEEKKDDIHTTKEVHIWKATAAGSIDDVATPSSFEALYGSGLDTLDTTKKGKNQTGITNDGGDDNDIDNSVSAGM